MKNFLAHIMTDKEHVEVQNSMFNKHWSRNLQQHALKHHAAKMEIDQQKNNPSGSVFLSRWSWKQRPTGRHLKHPVEQLQRRLACVLAGGGEGGNCFLGFIFSINNSHMQAKKAIDTKNKSSNWVIKFQPNLYLSTTKTSYGITAQYNPQIVLSEVRCLFKKVERHPFRWKIVGR